MATFWVWAVRNPLLTAAVLVCAAGAGGVFDRAFTLTVFAVLALCARAANVLAGRARGREEQRTAAAEALAISRLPVRSRYLAMIDDEEPRDAAA